MVAWQQSARRCPGAAYQREMEAKGFRPDLLTFGALMTGYERAGQADLIPGLFLPQTPSTRATGRSLRLQSTV